MPPPLPPPPLYIPSLQYRCPPTTQAVSSRRSDLSALTTHPISECCCGQDCQICVAITLQNEQADDGDIQRGHTIRTHIHKCVCVWQVETYGNVGSQHVRTLPALVSQSTDGCYALRPSPLDCLFMAVTPKPIRKLYAFLQWCYVYRHGAAACFHWCREIQRCCALGEQSSDRTEEWKGDFLIEPRGA